MTQSCPQSHSNALNVENILELSTLFHSFQKRQQNQQQLQQQLLQEQQQQYYKNENNEHDEEDDTNRINHDEDFFCEWKHRVKSVQIRSFF